MKIAFVLDAFSIGGIETVANNYINLLNKVGHIFMFTYYMKVK